MIKLNPSDMTFFLDDSGPKVFLKIEQPGDNGKKNCYLIILTAGMFAKKEKDIKDDVAPGNW